jgi:hypothetical protein
VPDRFAHRRQQLGAREWLRQNAAHPQLLRHGDRGTRTPPQSRGEKQYRACIHRPYGVDDPFGVKRVRHVDDDQMRFPCLANDLRQFLQGFDDNDIACLFEPALEQAKDQVVRFDNMYALLPLHDVISDQQSVTNV